MEEQNKVSLINESDSKLSRISQLQSEANFFQSMQDNHSWSSTLQNLFKEISVKLSPTEIEEVLKDMAIINRKLNSETLRINTGMRVEGFRCAPVGGDLYKLDIRLRKLLDLHNFGTPDKPKNPKEL